MEGLLASGEVSGSQGDHAGCCLPDRRWCWVVIVNVGVKEGGEKDVAEDTFSLG